MLKTDIQNVAFRLGEIEHLPVADASVDVIMSNCVINLSTDKPSVFREAFRGAAVSDVVGMLNDAGFQDVVVDVRSESRERGPVTEEAPAIQNLIASALIRAKKPFAGQSRG